MADLGWILILPALLLVVGVLFFLQYRLAVKERKWMMLILPALILATFLVLSAIAIQVSPGYVVSAKIEGMDGHGNILNLTIKVPKNGESVTWFSDLMVYNKEEVLVDELHLYYNDNKPEMVGSNLAYDKYIQDMLNGLKLDRSSQDEELITNGASFMGLTFEGNIVTALAFVFGIPFLLILFAGILPRFMNRKIIRAKAIAKVDIQSLDNGE